MAQTRLSNLGYFAIKKETTKGTAVTPNVYVPIYDENLITDVKLDLDNPIVGNKAEVYQTIQGQRSHSGEVTILAEPNIAGYLFDAFMTKGSTTGGGPYTHPFTISASTNPNSYTIDISKGSVVQRFMGCEISEVSIDFDTNKMVFKVKFSGLKSLFVREISSVSTNTVDLKTNYDPSPTDGFVTSDTVQILDVSAGTTQNFTVSSISDLDTLVLSGSPSGIVAGDLIYLRPATPSFSLLSPFLWARTEFRFGDDAASALSSSQTRLEQGSKWTLMHKFENDEGAMRSGSFDPAALVRTQSAAELEAKLFFDTPEDLNKFLTNTKKAVVVRHFSGTSYELRVTLNNVKFTEHPTNLNTGEIVYADGKMVAQYDSSDVQQFAVSIINNVSSI